MLHCGLHLYLACPVFRPNRTAGAKTFESNVVLDHHSWADILAHRLVPQKNMGAMADGDTDEFKRVLLEGNPFFLGLTFCVSLLHSVRTSSFFSVLFVVVASNASNCASCSNTEGLHLLRQPAALGGGHFCCTYRGCLTASNCAASKCASLAVA